MGLPEYLERVRPLVDRRVAELAGSLHFSEWMVRQVKGGKRLRALLCLLTCEALGGRLEDALDYAAAVEMVHCATLTHDDFIDGHTSRRGSKPLYLIVGPRKAVLLGDMLMATAIKYVRAEDGSKDALAQAIYDVSRGVLMEPLNPVKFLKSLQRGEAVRDAYPVLIKLKTAALFATACKLGALAASSDLADDAYAYGMSCGVAFQAADDLVDVVKFAHNGLVDLGTVTTLAPFAACFLGVKEAAALTMKALRGLRSGRVELPADYVALVDKACERAMDFVEKRMAEAAKFLSRFPENEYTSLLREFPSFAVRKMLEEGGLAWRGCADGGSA